MKKTGLFLSIVLSGLLMFSCRPNDTKLRTEVGNALSTNYPQVNYTVTEGVVTLSGNVTSDQIRTGAEQAAKSVKNIKSVTNNISVRTPIVTRSSDTDVTLRTQIITKMVNKGFNDVKVDVRDGEVILSGQVARNDLQEVMKIANESNPRKVTNQLTLK